MTPKNLFPAFCLMFFFVSFFSCQKTKDSIFETQDNISTSVSGRVTDANKNPVSGATVTAGTTIITTDINGNFRFNNVVISRNSAYIKIQKDGYFTGSRTFVANENTTNIITVELIPKTTSGSFSGSGGGSVSVASGGSIAFPANSVVNSTSKASYTGSVSVSAFFLNPTAPNLTSIMPGDLRGITVNNEERGLQSFGMMAVELNGSGGEKLQLASGKTATITFPIPASMQASAPATIPLWYFDEVKGLWKEEGSATKQGSNYVGTVTHFSFWNVDVPYPLVKIDAAIKDAGGKVLPGARVVIKPTTDTSNNSMVRSAYTDSAGKISGLIPANRNLNITIYNRCNTVVYSQNIGPFNNNANLGNITTNATAGATVIILGNVTNCSGSSVTNGIVNVSLNGINHRASVTNGTFSITIPACSIGSYTANIFAYDIAANVQGTATTITGTTGTTTNTNLIACGTTANQYINYTIGTTSYAFLVPADSISAYLHPPNATTSIYAFTQTSGNNRNISFEFSGLTSPGTTTLKYLNIYHGNLNLVKNGTLNVNISQYGNLYDYIVGSFSGSVKDSIGTNTYPVSCNFRVKRQ